MRPSCLILLGALLVFRPVFAAPDVDTLVSKMSLREKVGQVFLVGFPQQELDSQLRSFIATHRPGGFIAFRRNIKNSPHIRSLALSLRRAAQVHGAEPFLAIDQEGGTVTRIPYFPALPSALAVGLSGKGILAHELGQENGHLLRWHGFNLNLAPVLDLSDPKQFSFIGSRSYSSDPEISSEMGFQYSSGLISGGIIPTGKHFPGLGSTTTDPHVATGGLTETMEQFKERHLKPFERFARLGPLSAMMISQMSYPFLDSSGTAAPFSEAILKGLLRKDLGFKGLIMTDDLQMTGSRSIYTPADAALASLRAGADIVMITWSAKDQVSAFSKIEQSVKDGTWPLSELEERVRRILKVKFAIQEMQGALPSPLVMRNALGNPSTKRLHEIDQALLEAKMPPPRNISGEASSVKSDRICVLASNRDFLKSFFKSYEGRQRPLLLTNQSRSDKFRLSLKSCPLIVFAVHGRRSAQVLGEFDAPLREKTLVVNFAAEGLIPSVDGWLLKVELAHPHIGSAEKIAALTKSLLQERGIASSVGESK